MMPYARFQGDGKFAAVESVRTALLAGQLLFFSDCVGFIGDFQSWQYKRTQGGEIPKGDDAYEDANNDGCDVCMGMIANRHVRNDPVKVSADEQAALDYFATEFGEPATVSRD